MTKLIVLSNRISMPSGKASAGGLAVAVQDALNDSNGIWLVSWDRLHYLPSYTSAICTVLLWFCQ